MRSLFEALRFRVGRKDPREPTCPACEAMRAHIRFLENELILHRQRLEQENRLMRDQVITMANKEGAQSEAIVAEPEEPDRRNSEEVELELAETEAGALAAKTAAEMRRIAEQYDVDESVFHDF